MRLILLLTVTHQKHINFIDFLRQVYIKSKAEVVIEFKITITFLVLNPGFTIY